MTYTVIINNQSYDLPKKTIAITERLDEVAKLDEVRGMSIRDKFAELHDVIAELIGPENAAEAFGSGNLADIDTPELTLTFRKIVDAYNKPLTDYNMSRGIGEINSLPLDKLMTLVEAARQVNAMEKSASRKTVNAADRFGA